jgi:CubicO group peptidase (beta-lactamase class C family)
MQQLLIDVVGDPFSLLVKRLVLDPVGMASSTYEQPLPADREAAAAAGHHADGQMVAGRWHVYPEMAAAGLWTTPTDLLKWAMAIAAARGGAAGAILARATARDMLTAQKGPVGLGPFLEGDGAGFNFGHGGANEGFRSQVVYFPETGQGAAVMANSDNGTSVIQEVLFAVAAEYGWPEFGPREIEAIARDSAGLAPFVGTFEVPGPPIALVEFTAEGDRLFVEIVGYESKTEAVFVGPASVVALQSGMEITFELDGSGRATGLRAGPVRARRIR